MEITGKTKELGWPNCHIALFNYQEQMYFRFSDVASGFSLLSHFQYNRTNRLEKCLKENGKYRLTLQWEYNF